MENRRQTGIAPLLLVVILAVVALLMSTAIGMAAMYIGYLGKGDPATWESDGGESEDEALAGGQVRIGGSSKEDCGSSWWTEPAPTTSKGSYVNGKPSGRWVPCFPHKQKGKCGCACASMIIYAYTGQYINPDSMSTKTWAAVLNAKTGMNWQKRNRKVDNMEGVVQYIRAGIPVIVYSRNPKLNGKAGGMHIMVVTQYDEKKKAFLVHNSLPGKCRLQWVSRSFFQANPTPEKGQPFNGFVYRAPSI